MSFRNRSTQALLMTVLVAQFVACGGDGPTGTTPVSVASVAVTPAAATLVDLGETLQLTANARDANGNAISGKTFTWSSSDANIATVSTSGQVAAVANGSATISATTDGVSGTASLAVQDPDIDDDGILNAVDACPSEPENFNNLFDGDGCPDVPRDFYVAVKDDMEAFWEAEFAAGQLTYVRISLFQAYTQPINSPCGTLVLFNAFYCTVNFGVYYDDNFLTNIFLSQVGDAAPAFIIAHEIGHHVGFSLGWEPPVISQKQAELMADCLGGAWIADVANRGLLESGDLAEIIVTLDAIGDPAWTWFDPTQHGTAVQRAFAFAVGLDQGAGVCTSQAFVDLFPITTASN